MVIAATFQPPDATFSLNGKTSTQIKEQPMSITRAINNTGSQRGYLKQYFPIHSLSGLTRLQVKADVDLFSSPTGGNPEAVPFFRCSAGSDRGNAGATILINIKVTYFATMYERKVQTFS